MYLLFKLHAVLSPPVWDVFVMWCVSHPLIIFTFLVDSLVYLYYLGVRIEHQSLAGASFCQSLWTPLDRVLHKAAFLWNGLRNIQKHQNGRYHRWKKISGHVRVSSSSEKVLALWHSTWVKPALKLSWWSSLRARHRGGTVSCRRPEWCGRRSRPVGSPRAAGGGRWGRSAGASQGGLHGSEKYLHCCHCTPGRIQSASNKTINHRACVWQGCIWFIDFFEFVFSPFSVQTVTFLEKLAKGRLLDNSTGI